MNKEGPIVVIEDDVDDKEILLEVFKELNFDNEILFFNDSFVALDYITNTPIEPFIILSDVVMPKLSGMELREKIHNNEDLRLKCIPYLFFSTSAEQKNILEAYSKSIQGFFIKPLSYDLQKETIRRIVEYWQYCESPLYSK